MPHGLAITPEGRRVLVAGFGSNQVEAIDTRTNTIVWKTSVAQPHNLGIAPDVRTAYAASQHQGHQALAILDVASLDCRDGDIAPVEPRGRTVHGVKRRSVPLDHMPRALNVSPDGEEVFFTEAGVNAVLVLDRATNEIVTRIPVGASPHHPLFRPDGKVGTVVAQRPGELDRSRCASMGTSGSRTWGRSTDGQGCRSI